MVSTRFKVLTLDLGDDRMEVVTLDARSGQPIADAKVSFYSSYDEKNRKVMAEVLTDAGGKLYYPGRVESEVMWRVKAETQV